LNLSREIRDYSLDSQPRHLSAVLNDYSVAADELVKHMSKKVNQAKSQSSSVRASSQETYPRESAKSAIKMRSHYNGSFINAMGTMDSLKVEGKNQKALINVPSNDDLQTLCGWESKKSSKQSRKQTVFLMNPPDSSNVMKIKASENSRYPLQFGNNSYVKLDQSYHNIRHGEVQLAEEASSPH